MKPIDRQRVVLLHDWLTGVRGAEKVLEVFCRKWPNAPLYTLLHKKGSTLPAIESLRPRTSFLGFLPFVDLYYRWLLPLMPLAIECLKLPACDLVLSSSYCVVKSVRVPRGAQHVCYCHTPMRYAWHMDGYFTKRHGIKYWILGHFMAWLRAWDRRTAKRVTHFIANSRVVQQRILTYYGRHSEVIYPPVNTDYYYPANVPREDFYLIVSAFAPYKRLDLAVAACNALKRPLVIIGGGEDDQKLRQMAGPTVNFLGRQPDEVLRDHMRRCRALLFPGEEDFGIVPVEAQACGAPVIAFARGGVTETVIPLHQSEAKPTGLWFKEQTTESLIAAIEEFEKHEKDFDPHAIRNHASEFNSQRFEKELFEHLATLVKVNNSERHHSQIHLTEGLKHA